MFDKVCTVLRRVGYTVTCFPTAETASDYLNREIDGKTVGVGGSMTLYNMGLADRLETHNTVFSHMYRNGVPTMDAAQAQIYLSSANALAETGEIVLIDGYGNRASGVLFGHEKVYLVIGRNKLAPTYEEAVWRARNIAAPKNAQRKGAHTPCAINADCCYDCKSDDRICKMMITLWGPPRSGMEIEIILIDQDLGF